MRLVVVEDDALLRHALAAFFKGSGMELVATSADGADALALLSSKSIRADLILTDCQMPRMDGIALVRHLRARGDRTPVIMMSGQTDPAVREQAMQAGVSRYLTKPLAMRTLSQIIDQTLGTAA
jgi:DNA-binding response OmpR family regulator